MLVRKVYVEKIDHYLRLNCNLLITGPKGSSKTSTLSAVLGDYSSVYIDCLETTTFSLLTEILRQYDIPVIRQACSFNELVASFLNLIQAKRHLVIVLDNADQLREKSKTLLILGKFLKYIQLVIIAEKDFLNYIDKKLVRRFVFAKIEFVPYSSLEILELLKERYRFDEYMIASIARESKNDVNVAFSIADKFSTLENITPAQFLKTLEGLRL